MAKPIIMTVDDEPQVLKAISKSFVVSIFGWKHTEISHPPEYMLLGKILVEKK